MANAIYVLVKHSAFAVYYNHNDVLNKLGKGAFHLHFETIPMFIEFVEQTPFAEWKQYKVNLELEDEHLENSKHQVLHRENSPQNPLLDPPRQNEGQNPVSQLLNSTAGPAYVARRIRTRRRVATIKKKPSPPPTPATASSAAGANRPPYTGKKRGRKPKAELIALAEAAASVAQPLKKKAKKDSEYDDDEEDDDDERGASGLHDEDFDGDYNPLKAKKKRHTNPPLRHYICAHCGKIFDKKYNHDSHARVHLTTKPHKCFLCGKGFARNSDKKRHEKGHLKKMEKLGINDRQLMEQMIRKERDKELERQKLKSISSTTIQTEQASQSSDIPSITNAIEVISGQLNAHNFSPYLQQQQQQQQAQSGLNQSSSQQSSQLPQQLQQLQQQQAQLLNSQVGGQFKPKFNNDLLVRQFQPAAQQEQFEQSQQSNNGHYPQLVHQFYSQSQLHHPQQVAQQVSQQPSQQPSQQHAQQQH